MSTLFGPRDGATYDERLDRARLNAQQVRVFRVMRDGMFRTLREIADATGDGEASVSARIRDFRKDRFGGSKVDRRRRHGGTWEYALRPSDWLLAQAGRD